MYTNRAEIKMLEFRGFGRAMSLPALGDVAEGYTNVQIYEGGMYQGGDGELVKGQVVEIGEYWSNDQGQSGRFITVEWKSEKPFQHRVDF